MSGGGFSPRAAVALILAGLAMLLVMGWAVGAGFADGDLNDGGGHAGGTGLNGYAGFYRLLDNAGYDVTKGRDPAALQQPGLLVLTPNVESDPQEMDRVVAAHRKIGPVLVLQPKWQSYAAQPDQPGYHRGWTRLDGADGASWPGFRDDVAWQVKPLPGGIAMMPALGLKLHLPAPEAVVSARGRDLAPLVIGSDRRFLAFYTTDGAPLPALDRLAAPDANNSPGDACGSDDDDRPACLYPLVFVVEPDLFNNWGMARPENATMAEAIVAGAFGRDPGQPASHDQHIIFDLTFNGLGRSPNPISNAFSPPWLAATMCLLLAAFAVGWRGFLRFGPTLRRPREIAFGKRALLESSAGLVLRAHRHHLLAGPYLVASRERAARALGAPRGSADATALIDRALARKTGEDHAFSKAASALLAARGAAAITAAARELHALETLIAQGN